jgi:hypothetical protein
VAVGGRRCLRLVLAPTHRSLLALLPPVPDPDPPARVELPVGAVGSEGMCVAAPEGLVMAPAWCAGWPVIGVGS